MIGRKAEQRRIIGAAFEVVYRGEVVACERGGTPASWTALLLLADGRLINVPTEYLYLVPDVMVPHMGMMSADVIEAPLLARIAELEIELTDLRAKNKGKHGKPKEA